MTEQRRIIVNNQTGERMIWDNGKTYPVPEGAGYKGSILPFSNDEFGDTHFDPNAGLLGMIIGGATLPGDVATGKTQVRDAGGDFNPEVIERGINLTAMASPAPVAMRAGEKAIPGVAQALTKEMPDAPTTQMLKKAGAAGFERARATGVDYSAGAIKSMADDLRAVLDENGFSALESPKTYAVIDGLRTPPTEAGASSVFSISNWLTARRRLQKAAQDRNPLTGEPTAEAEAARRSIDALDEFSKGAATAPAAGESRAVADVGGVQSEAARSPVVRGDAKAAAAAIEQGRGNYAAYFRSKQLDRAEEIGSRNAAKNNSGLNLGGSLKDQINTILKDPKRSAGYSKDELKFLDDIVRGKLGERVVRYAGNALGGGGGIAAPIVAAIMSDLGGGMGVGLTAVGGGLGLRMISNKMVKGSLGKVNEAVRMRAPLYKELLEKAPLSPDDPSARSAFIRAIMLLATPATGKAQSP